MVYSGKPSTGCGTCKKRRIKCDEGRPVCLQCIRAKRDCSGYPDATDLLFQDQTTRTIKRAHQAIARRRKAESSHGTQDDSDSGDSPVDLVLFETPQNTIEVTALNFYMDGMILGNMAEGHSMGHLELLPKLFLQSPSNSALSLAATTAGLAALGKVGTDSSRVRTLAMENYGKTVKSLSVALQNPVARKQNETLMAAMLMIVVESLLAEGSAPADKWMSHIMGATTLVISRGDEIFDDPVALRLYYAIRKFLVNGASIRGEKVHPFFAQGPPVTQTTLSAPGYKLGLISNQLQGLRPHLLNLIDTATTLEEYSTLSELSDRCRSMEDELSKWPNDLPDDYVYEVFEKTQADSYISQTDDYESPYVLRVWNNYRCTRIFVKVLISRIEAKLLEGIEDVADIYNPTLQQLADDICSSVPSQICDGTTIVTSGQVTKKISTIQEAYTAFYLLWPLYLARSLPGLPAAQCEWIRNAMSEIASKYRIRDGMALVHLADKDPGRPLMMDRWERDAVENVWENSFNYGAGGI